MAHLGLQLAPMKQFSGMMVYCGVKLLLLFRDICNDVSIVHDRLVFAICRKMMFTPHYFILLRFLFMLEYHKSSSPVFFPNLQIRSTSRRVPFFPTYKGIPLRCYPLPLMIFLSHHFHLLLYDTRFCVD